jgi:hypothetical protein
MEPNAATQQLTTPALVGEATQLLLIVGRAFLERRRRVVAVLQRGEPVSEDLITLDSAIEFLLLTNEYVAQLLQTALEVSDTDFKIVETSVFGHR